MVKTHTGQRTLAQGRPHCEGTGPRRFGGVSVLLLLGAVAWTCQFDPGGVDQRTVDAGSGADASQWDGSGVDSGTKDPCDRDGDGFQSIACGGTDCDDGDPERWPEFPEKCDGKDNDCDGVVDEGLEGSLDLDGDGITPCGGDCDDDDPDSHPWAVERCDGVDNDCDGDVDGDADCDGDGYSPLHGDCDDDDPGVYPWAPEPCDGVDNDCDTVIDEGCI